MGFGREARRVRDEALSHGDRLRALAHCVKWAQPVGFNTSWHYLETKLGTPRESVDFLAPALELLERERRLYVELDLRYSTLRRRQKEQGSRTPRLDEVTSRSPARWHGDECAAAVHALSWWLQRHPLENFVDVPEAVLAIDVARTFATGPSLTSVDRAGLQRSLDWARAGVRAQVGLTLAERRRTHEVLQLLGHIYIVINGAPLVGSPWNFTASPDELGRREAVARTYLRVPVGLWRSAWHDGLSGLIDAASDLLVLGYDTPSLRELAGLSPRESLAAVEFVVSAALEELGVGDLLNVGVYRAGLVSRLVLYLEGDLSLRELSSWAHQMIGHGGAYELQPFVELDDIYDDWEDSGHDLSHLDVVTRKAARDLLADRSVTRLDRIEPPVTEAAQVVAVQPLSWRDRLRNRRRPTN